MAHATHEEYIATLHRLAEKARAEGVQLKQDARDGRFYASSVSSPGTFHYVTGVSCDCAGFVHHGACKHYAALLSSLGWLGDNGPGPDASHGVVRLETHTGAIVEVSGLTSMLYTSHGADDISDDVPATYAGHHASIAAWWRLEVARWAREASEIAAELVDDDNALAA